MKSSIGKMFLSLISTIQLKFEKKQKLLTLLNDESFLVSVTQTSIFIKMTVQDKIIFLAKLIEEFECDYGYMPEQPTNVLLELNNQLNSSVLNQFRGYSRAYN